MELGSEVRGCGLKETRTHEIFKIGTYQPKCLGILLLW